MGPILQLERSRRQQILQPTARYRRVSFAVWQIVPALTNIVLAQIQFYGGYGASVCRSWCCRAMRLARALSSVRSLVQTHPIGTRPSATEGQLRQPKTRLVSTAASAEAAPQMRQEMRDRRSGEVLNLRRLVEAAQL